MLRFSESCNGCSFYFLASLMKNLLIKAVLERYTVLLRLTVSRLARRDYSCIVEAKLEGYPISHVSAMKMLDDCSHRSTIGLKIR